MNPKSFRLCILMAAAGAATSTGSAPAKADPKASPAPTATSPAGAPAVAVNSTQTAPETPATGATPPASTGEVPSSTDPALAQEAARKRAPKNPENKLNIINGRLPFPLVHLIRTAEAGKPTAETAKRYGTSVGKVFDIHKGRNFSYIDAGYKPSAEEMAQARNWLTTAKTFKGQTLKEAGGDPEGIAKLLDGMVVATNDEVAKRNWNVRQGAVQTGNQAPVAPAGAAPAGGQAAAPAEKPAGAKLF